MKILNLVVSPPSAGSSAAPPNEEGRAGLVSPNRGSTEGRPLPQSPTLRASTNSAGALGPRADLADREVKKTGQFQEKRLISIEDISQCNIEIGKVFTSDGLLELSEDVPKPQDGMTTLLIKRNNLIRVKMSGGTAWIDFFMDFQKDPNEVRGITGYPYLTKYDLGRLERAGILQADFVKSACESPSMRTEKNRLRTVIAAKSHAPLGKLTPLEQIATAIKDEVRETVYSRKVEGALKSDNKMSRKRHGRDAQTERSQLAASSVTRCRKQLHATASDWADATWQLKALNCQELAIACIKAAEVLHHDPDSVTLVENGDHVVALLGPKKEDPIPSRIEAWPGHWVICDPWMNIACRKSEWQSRALLKLQDWDSEENDKVLSSSQEVTMGLYMHATYPPLVRSLLHSPWKLHGFELGPDRPRAQHDG